MMYQKLCTINTVLLYLIWARTVSLESAKGNKKLDVDKTQESKKYNCRLYSCMSKSERHSWVNMDILQIFGHKRLV